MTDPNLFTAVHTSRTFRNLAQHYNLHKKSVLDVGCSEGHYLQCFGSGSAGVTIIKEHVRAANERGLEVYLKNAEDSQFSMDRTFDVVWANNLFEHLHAPHLFLTKMRQQVTENGMLILGVPVIPFFSFLTRFKKFRGAYAVSHVNFFTRQTLIDTVRAAGWIVEEARLFYFENRFLDFPFNLIAPHIYIVAHSNPQFKYAKKRLASLEGYHSS